VNTRKAKVLCFDGSTSEVAWAGLQPGMVVLIEDRGEFPADLIPLVSSEEAGKCYIETANIDGETNLKLKTAAMGLKGFKNVEELLEHKISISFEPPSASIHSFSATLDGGKKGKAALGPMELLLRGAVLRNTKWIMGVIVYTGFETKLVMNSRDAPSKLSTVEQMVNEMIYCILGAMLFLTSLTTLGYYLWNLDHGMELWYLCLNMRRNGVPEMFSKLCEKGSWSEYPLASLWPTFFILYNNFLPISLYVTVELVNVAQAYFVDQDLNM
jgi:phospholipid-transporting ATPase